MLEGVDVQSGCLKGDQVRAVQRDGNDLASVKFAKTSQHSADLEPMRSRADLEPM